MSFPVLVALAGGLMILSALLLFTGSGVARRRLRERVLATREIKVRQALNESLLTAPVERSALLTVASWLGYRSDLPPAFAASPTIIVPSAALIGLVAFNLVGRILPKSAALGVAIVLTIVVARYLFRRKTKIYQALLFKQIPDTMSLLLRAVRAGLPVAEAIRSVGRESMSPTKDEFARVAGEAALGSPIETAVRRMADRIKIQEYAFLAVIIGLHGQTGGNLSETLENMADMVRRRVAMAAKGKALSAEGRLSAAVIGVLPFGVGLLVSVFNPSYLNEFVTNRNGPTLIVAFAVLLCTGLFVTHLMIQKSMED